MMQVSINKAASSSMSKAFSIAQDSSQTLVNNACCEEATNNLKRKRLKQRNEYLPKETMLKMIWRILTEKHYPEEKLAHALGITVKSLKQFCSQKCSASLIPKINLPLIKLYCVTRFHV